VTIGHNTNLQDAVHVGSLAANGPPTTIGSHVSVGHGAVLAGCTVHDTALIGMNAVLQEGVTVGGPPASNGCCCLPGFSGGAAAAAPPPPPPPLCAWVRTAGAATVLPPGALSSAPCPRRCRPSAQVEAGAMVAAGAVVPAHATVPSGELWAGNPARCAQQEAPPLPPLPGAAGVLAAGDGGGGACLPRAPPPPGAPPRAPGP
jgi:hypothetical protein